MKITFFKRRAQKASVLFTVIIIGAIMGIAIAATLTLSNNSVKNAHGRVDWNKAYFTSENALVWATQYALENPLAPGASTVFSWTNQIPRTALVNNDPNFKGALVTVQRQITSLSAVYVITASSRINDKVRTLQANVTAFPVSTVFDYEYFLNNWGWWWGTPIYGQGGQRSNWDFDLRGSPTVNGLLYTANLIKENFVTYTPGVGNAPFIGMAADDPVTYVHPGASRVDMPNLLNFSNYIATAMANTSSNGIWIGNTQVVVGVVNGGSSTGVSGIYLVGTDANPIVIKGTAVVPGNVVIKGVVTGKGTLYVGGDMYVAGNLQYKNGPDFSSPPETMSATNRDAWVTSNQSKDLIAYAVNGSVFGGDVTDGDWINYEYWYGGSGLYYVGDESQLGQDGIKDTGDDGIPFLHADGSMSAWYDADGNGVVNRNYNYETDINMTADKASKIQGYPTTTSGSVTTPVPYSAVANDNIGHFDGVFYTDHALAIRSAAGSTVFNGTVISRNEQIVFNSVCTFNYDSRIHSRYHNDPNSFVNLGLPYGKTLAVNSLVELPPNYSGLGL